MGWITSLTRTTTRAESKPADEIYLLRAKVTRPGLFSRSETIWKIGITGRNPESRIDDIAAENGPKFEKVYSQMTPNARRIESKLHGRFKGKNINFKKERFRGIDHNWGGKTECFYLSAADVEDVRIAFGCDVSGNVAIFHGSEIWFIHYTIAVLLALMYAKFYYF